MRTLFTGLAVTTLLFSVSVYSKDKPKKEKKLKKVFTLESKKEELSDKHSFPALVVSSINSKVFSDSPGHVNQLKVKIGSKVKKGQVLATIKHTDPSYNYNSFRSVSPVDGIVNKVNVTAGSLVTKGQELFQIIDPTKTKVVIEIAARDLSKLKNGMEASLKTPYAKELLKLKLSGIAPTIDAATGTASGELEFHTGDNEKVRVGTLGQVSFKTNIRKGIKVPDHAIVYKGTKPHIRLVEKNKVKFSLVTLGNKQSGFVEVLSGLKSGETFINRTSGFISDGDEVEVQK